MKTPKRFRLGVMLIAPLLMLGLALVAAESRSAGTSDTVSRWTAPTWRWRRVPVRVSGQGEGLVAVAVQSGSPSRTAVADQGGVSLRVGDEPFRFAARVRGVTDLAFAADGALWIGSVTGLWHLAADGRLLDRSPAPGERARAIHRVSVGRRTVAVATEAGAWLLEDGVRWRRLAERVPFGPVSALALAEDADALWLVVGEEVWRVGLESTSEARRIDFSGAPTGVAPTDVVAGLPGSALTLVYPRALAMLVSEEVASRPVFRVVRPAWPPGAVAKRLVAGAGRLWLATDVGLLHAPSLAGSWRRSEAPAGSAPIRSIAGDAPDAVLAATGLGLLQGAPVLLAGTREPAPEAPRLRSRLPADPDVRAVHAASLRYLDLGPDEMRSLRSGLRHRGWLPTLSLRVAAARDRTWQRDYDEAFLSGDMRRLNDREKDKSLDLEASIVMSWSLGDIAFDDSAIDLSREHRQVVVLRDNVIDEINQLYFERRGLLQTMDAADAPPDHDRRALELRAAELAAGLDAWTGGWFSRQHAHPPNGLSPIPEETP